MDIECPDCLAYFDVHEDGDAILGNGGYYYECPECGSMCGTQDDMQPQEQKVTEEKQPLKIDIGAGKNKLAGFTGIDAIAFDGIDIVHDMRVTPWPFEDGQVDEVHSSHFLEHLTNNERVAFFNELYRVLKVGGTARIITPHWSNERAYGDPTHQWPPVTSWLYFYLQKSWRDVNAPHVGYTCDFDYTLVGTLDPNDTNISMRNDETKGWFMRYNINACVDLVATLTKRPC